jgi:hypothetical protein
LPTSWHRAPLIWPSVCDPWEPIDRPVDRHTGGEVPYVAADRFHGRRLESVFRLAPELGHCPMQPALRICADTVEKVFLHH